MSGFWRIRLCIWPYSSIKRGADAAYLSAEERKVRGAEMPEILVKAQDFNEAHGQALSIMQGVMLDERVWKVQIRAILFERGH